MSSDQNQQCFDNRGDEGGWWEWFYVVYFLLIFLLVILRYLNLTDLLLLTRNLFAENNVADDEEDDSDDNVDVSSQDMNNSQASSFDVQDEIIETGMEEHEESKVKKNEGIIQRPLLTNNAIEHEIDNDLRVENPLVINNEFGVSDNDFAFIAKTIKELNWEGLGHVESVLRFRRSQLPICDNYDEDDEMAHTDYSNYTDYSDYTDN